LNATQPATSLVNNATSPIVSMLPLSASSVNFEPKFLGDTLGVAYDAIMACADTSTVSSTCQQQDNAKQSSTSTVDSLYYDVYVANADGSRTWAFLNVALSNVTPIDLDGNSADGVNGADLLIAASLTPSQGSA